MRLTTTFLTDALGWCVAACALGAGSAVVAQVPASGGSDYALLGTYGATVVNFQERHAVYGGAARVGWSRLGVWGMAQTGSGAHYDSQLAAVAVSWRLLDGRIVGVHTLAGGGWYKETGATGIERAAPGVLAGGIALSRVGPLRVGIAALDLFGEYRQSDVLIPVRFHVPRVSLMIGL